MELIAISIDTSFATMVKGKGHGYVKRELTGKPKPKYRYWYKMPNAGIVTDSSLHVGAKFKHGTGDNEGHYEITAGPTALGNYAVKHDETGDVKQMSPRELREFIHRHHDTEHLLPGLDRRKKAFEAAWRHGTDKQVAEREKDLLEFAQAYWGTTRLSQAFLAQTKRDVSRRITPLGSRQRQTPEDIRRATEQQNQILQSVVDAYKIEDRAAIKQAREKWTQHRKRFGNLVSGYREKVSAAKQEAISTRSARRELEQKARARAQAQDKALKAYTKYETRWAREGMPRPKNDTEAQITEMNTQPWRNHYRDHIATFGDASVTSSSGSGYSFVVSNQEGKQITTNFSRSINREHAGSFATIDNNRPVLDLHNNYLKIKKEMRGGDWNAQKMYARQEDWFKEATRNLPADQKANVVVTIYADINVGKYYWATQGFRYKNNDTRTSHLRSMIRQLDKLINNEAPILPPLTKGGQSRSMTAHGWDSGKLQAYRNYLESERVKATSGVSNDEKVEPWELLDKSPDGPPVWVKNTEWEAGDDPALVPKYIKCGLAKLLMLNSIDWHSVKHVHTPTPRDKEAAKAGDRRRAVSAMNAAKSGKLWPWLGDAVNEKLAGLQKSLFGFATRVSSYTSDVLGDELRIRFALSKAEDEGSRDRPPKDFDDGIREDNLLSYEDETAITNLARAEDGVALMDEVIALFDEMLSTPDVSKDEEK